MTYKMEHCAEIYILAIRKCNWVLNFYAFGSFSHAKGIYFVKIYYLLCIRDR